MKQTFTSARRPLEILIHIIGWGIMFGFPFFFVERKNDYSIRYPAGQPDTYCPTYLHFLD